MCENRGLDYDGPYALFVQEFFDKRMLSELGYRFDGCELDLMTLQIYRACAKGQIKAKPKKR